jgi:pilus assembly protein CpaE
VALKVALIGSRDRQLDEILRAAGMKVAALEIDALPAMANPSAQQPDVIVLDLRTDSRIPASLSAIRRQHPTTGIVIAASALDPALMLQAMRAGVNELVSDPITQLDLEQAITRVVAQRHTTETGKLFGFVGAKGGVGTTTVAVNVAAILGAHSPGHPALLMDLHQAGGDAAVFLSAEPRFSFADALDNTHRLDSTFFHGLVAHAGPELDLLASPERALAGQADAAKIRTIIEFAGSAYKHTVLDLPRSDAAVLDALDMLNAIVIVVNQELATVKSAGRLAAALRQRYGREKILIVVSRSDRQADIGHADVERAVGGEIAHTFPSDYRVALQALNKGRPLAFENHSDLSGSLKRFAFQLAGIKAEVAAPRTGFLGRLSQGRRS